MKVQKWRYYNGNRQLSDDLMYVEFQ